MRSFLFVARMDSFATLLCVDSAVDVVSNESQNNFFIETCMRISVLIQQQQEYGAKGKAPPSHTNRKITV